MAGGQLTSSHSPHTIGSSTKHTCTEQWLPGITQIRSPCQTLMAGSIHTPISLFIPSHSEHVWLELSPLKHSLLSLGT